MRRSLQLVLLASAGVALTFAYRSGVFARLADPTSIARQVAVLGPRGYVGFVLAYALLQPIGVPGTAFVLAAPLIWPWPIAFALSMAGTMAASVVGFMFSRFVARDWVARRIPERFRRYDEALEKRGFATVFLLRLIFWMPPPLHAFFGVSRVRFWTHFWGSLAGYVLPLLAVTFFGQAFFAALRSAGAATWIALGVLVAAGATLYWVWTRSRRAT